MSSVRLIPQTKVHTKKEGRRGKDLELVEYYLRERTCSEEFLK
ncbi:hypothetical protein LEP1GSC058_2583 [Leptospira fainei serovar Hurstbridge str. BUT 6]|uniref:Uncharacterized protein n=1 Tax=Leptospira fainei serovar Hurstbridge str. BUT 6 TaxID=1193011 RepID=S3UR30_9LEPT|nr:hypothetical protein LEP1GSC058_2583 [Leptospira fainei serovar Hurstbridge str. BUT 6]